jgi:hypothetical protein
VYIEFNSRYREANGVIDGKRMTGTTQNVVGYRTTFELTRQ